MRRKSLIVRHARCGPAHGLPADGPDCQDPPHRHPRTCSLCVDDLEGIGGFLELERLVTDDVTAEAIQAELAAFVASFGATACTHR